MIKTSELYKGLLEQGAIQEYKIVVDGIDYTGDVIYDGVSLKQQLFSTDTFSVGGFALAKMTVKLKVPTIDIPRNASVKFFYRLTNYEQTSEWIQKFNGRILKRKRYSNEVTTIEAVSKGANYDVFLDIFQTTIPSYPANNRTVANLCARHLGLEIDDINKVFDGDNVEYPNELTIIEVLQNIAALSGGNWIITEDDKLRLVVLENTITSSNLKRYSAFNVSSNETLLPISKVTMYYQDDKAFTSGDDRGSELTIDCPWATQLTTDYVLNLYRGYIYNPVTGTGINIDGAIQLGDSFLYDNDEVQLVANIDYSFKGALAANINAPTTSEVDYEDIYKELTAAPFKRKVTLGDSYQGVTIDRENGITMLLSPDGTAENAIAKYYADLNKGMAFQYRDSPQDPWEDWLYFDVPEKRFKLMLRNGQGDIEDKLVVIETNVDGIKHEVAYIHDGNVIYNLNGVDGFTNWELIGGLEFEDNTFGDKIFGGADGLQYIEGMKITQGARYGYGFFPTDFPNALNGKGISFFNTSLSPKGEIRENNYYSFRGRVMRFVPFQIDVMEYSYDKDLIKSTPFKFNDPVDYAELTITPQPSSKYVALRFTSQEWAYDNLLQLAEMMFNRGEPKEWFEGVDEVRAYATSKFEQLADKMVLMVDGNGRMVLTELGLDPETGSYYRVKADNIELEGLTTINEGFKVLENGDVEMTNAKVSGNLLAGNIAGFEFNDKGIYFPDGNMSLSSEHNAIMVGDTGLYYGQGGTFTFKIMNDDTSNGDNYGAVQIRGDGSMTLDKLIGNPLELEGSAISINSVVALNLKSNAAKIILDSKNGIDSYGKLRNNQIQPYDNSSFSSLGSPTERYGFAYLRTQPNVSSDSRYKRNILPIDDKLIDIFGREVEPRTYTMRDEHNIHFGYIAQDVERALYKYTLSTHGLKEAKSVVSEFAVLSKSESYMSLLYGEIAVIMDAYNRRRMDKLEKRIQALERMI